jgi:hypothetical protein
LYTTNYQHGDVVKLCEAKSGGVTGPGSTVVEITQGTAPLKCAIIHLLLQSPLKLQREIVLAIYIVGTRGSVAVEALCYKPEGHGFKTE